MLRFAISPTSDMNIGNLRVAIFNYILSKQLGEDLLIRIDDTDKEKNIEGKEKEIIELLSLFSIEHKFVIYQSENLKYHQKMAMQLMSKKQAFSCFCSDNKLNELKQEAEKANKEYSYDGFCATLSDETVLNCNAPFVVRMLKPEGNIKFTDKIKGELNYSSSAVDSFVILKHDKTPTYNYACAIDDMLNNISMVIRDEEYLSNTPKQIHIRDTFSYDKEIEYVHLPKISNQETDKESSVKWLIEQGFLPAAIANYLVLLGNDTPEKIFTLEDAIKWVDLTKLSQEVTKFDIEKLKVINKEHLSMMDDMRLSKLLGFADSDIGKLAKVYLEEADTLNELKSKIEPIFTPKTSCEGFEDEMNQIKKCLKDAPYIDSFNDLEIYITNNSGLKDEKMAKPLRYILTGSLNGPSISDIYPHIKNYLGEIIK